MRKTIHINILDIRKGALYIAGNVPNYRYGSERLLVTDENEKRTELEPVRAKALDRPAVEGKKALSGYFYELSLPLHPGAYYSFSCLNIPDGGGNPAASGIEEAASSEIPDASSVSALSPRYGKFSRLLDTDGSFFRKDGFLVISEDGSIRILEDRSFTALRLSHHLNNRLKKEFPAEALSLRSGIIEYKKRQSRPLWLISDRSDSAGDNGEALFEYLMKDKDGTGARDRLDIRFVISSDSPDFERMKQLGPVVGAGSDQHRLLFAAADLMISSAGDEWVRNPLGSDLKYCRDLIDTRFVFLQHGVVMNDLSGWLHRNKKDLSIFITSARDEYSSVCQEGYGYGSDVVKLTGLARYDKLISRPEKKIAILPTWRKYAAADLIPGSSDRPYSEEFKNTEYFRFYDSLINDPALIDSMKRCGYTGVFYLHPSHMKQWRDFRSNDTISVWKGIVPFTEVFNSCSLLVTDYSSVAIDFAYNRKPVIYAQFDKDKYYETHTVDRGYFDYARDGFGPVYKYYDSTVNGIISVIESGCENPEIYDKRISSFFAFNDSHNCRRIYKELEDLSR